MFGWYTLIGDEFKQLGSHIAAGSGFVSNLVLWSESGYFDNISESKPLLHLWSLGIEEQFYLVWPTLLWLAQRSKLNLLLVTCVALALSFCLNIYGISQDAVATFYSPLTRFWELWVGSLLAYLTLHEDIETFRFTVRKANAISAVGFALILLAIIFTPRKSGFPGWWAVLPALGSALVIAAGTESWINRNILSNNVAVGVGLISFPLYLWHWPLLAFGRIVQGQEPDRLFRVGTVVASTALAWVTYRYVERYIRFSKGNKFALLLVILNIFIGTLGGYVYVSGGLEGRSTLKDSGLNNQVARQFMGAHWPYSKNEACLNEYQYENAGKLAWWFCMKSDYRSPTLVILGNSYANQLYPGFTRNPALRHHTILSIGTCDFVATEDNVTGDPNEPCYGGRAKEQRDYIDKLIASERSIKFIVVGGMRNEPDDEYINGLRARIKLFESRGIRVVVFTPHLTAERDPADYHPSACFTRPLRGKAKDCSFSVDKRNLLDSRFSSVIDAIAKSNPNVRFFEQNEVFCDATICSFVRDDMPLLRDEYSHISEYASVRLQKYFTVWARENIPEIFDTELIGRELLGQ